MPHSFTVILLSTGRHVPESYYPSWEQAAAYVVRLNDRTVAKLQEIRAERFTETPSLNHAISVSAQTLSVK